MNARARVRAALPGATVLARAPGRINLLGEHTDYNGGLALPVATDLCCVVGLSSRDDGQVRVHALDPDERWSPGHAETPEWAHHVRGALAIAPPGRGVDAVFAGDVPLGAGMSSSAALGLAWLNALHALRGEAPPPLSLALEAQRIEHEYVGVQCGLLDQIASQCSIPGHVLQVDFGVDPPGITPIPAVLEGWSWVALHTGLRRSLSHSAYSERVRSCRDAKAALGVDNVRALGSAPAHPLLRHVWSENRRVLEAAGLLRQGRALELGALLGQSHASLRDDYRVSCPELDQMAALASGHPACAGARMMGAGFGGCVLALVRAEQAETFAEATLRAYRGVHPLEARAIHIRTGDGARAL